MSHDVDELDLVLLDGLHVNPRVSFYELGRVLGVSGVTAARRWRRLVGAGRAWVSSAPGPSLPLVGALIEGADVTINTKDETVAAAVLQATNAQGVDITIDHIGGDLFAELPAATRIGGVIVNIGRLGGADVTLNLDELSFRRQRLYGTTFGVRTPDEMAGVFAALRPDVTDAVAERRITALIDHIYSPEDCEAAADRLRANQTFGKVIFAFGAPTCFKASSIP